MPASLLDKAKGHEVIWPNVSELLKLAAPILGAPYVYFITDTDLSPDELWNAVSQAHIEHDHTAIRPDTVRLLGNASGYVEHRAAA